MVKYLVYRQGRFAMWVLDGPLYVHDPELGYRYRPNASLRLRHFDATNRLVRSNEIKVNNQGHISPRDDAVAKPPSEFRIAVLGDSFVASVTNDVPWPAMLEDVLNADGPLKRAGGAASFKVINFGMDGTGIGQFARVFEGRVRRFAPDLVMVNFITDDVMRRFVWRDTLGASAGGTEYQLTLACYSLPVSLRNPDCAVSQYVGVGEEVAADPARLREVKTALTGQQVRRLPWLSPYPDLLAWLWRRAGGPLQVRLTPWGNAYYRDEEEALGESAGALRRMASQHPRLLVLHLPVYEEILAEATPELARRLAARLAGIRMVPMREAILREAEGGSVEAWFQLPHDRHFSNYGAERYARAVHRALREYLRAAVRAG